MVWRDRLQSWIPTREKLEASRWVRWLAPWLGHPKLWHWSRRGVALGVALGVFFGLLIPVAQIPLTATAAVVLRANLPAAVASTLISNPVTFGPLYYAAYRLGSWVTGETSLAQEDAETARMPEPDKTLWQRVTSLRKPLLVGLLIMASLCGLATYALIYLFWRWRTGQRWRGRRGAGE
jgi:uncharacterized protein (DUF2062 family)